MSANTPVAAPAPSLSAQEIHSVRASCRACGGSDLQCFLPLGPTPLANSFLHHPDEFSSEPWYPLDVYFCRTCSLVQVLDVIHPEALFRNYIYVSGTSDTMLAHNARYARTVMDLLHPTANDLIVEVASNDGSFLKHFRHFEVRTLGIEPALNLAEIARHNGIPTLPEFFNSAMARRVRESFGPAKAIIGNNVLAHVDDTIDFLSGASIMLADDGLVIVEVPHVRDLVERLEYDTVYHEHLCYFSATSLMRLCDSVGLSIFRMDRVPVHGGSLRMYAGLKKHYGGHGADALNIARMESEAGLDSLARYQCLARDVEQNRHALTSLLKDLKQQGKTIAGYGAPAKGNTLLNYCRISTDLVPYTVDKNPLKVGLYTPGMHLPVRPVGTLLECQPDYVLILAWNFAQEIIAQQHEYQARGGRFIIPIPHPAIV